MYRYDRSRQRADADLNAGIQILSFGQAIASVACETSLSIHALLPIDIAANLIHIDMKLAYIGIHSWDVPPHDSTPGNQWGFVQGLLYTPILAMIRKLVLIFLFRVGGTKRGVSISVWTIGTVIFCFMNTKKNTNKHTKRPIDH